MLLATHITRAIERRTRDDIGSFCLSLVGIEVDGYYKAVLRLFTYVVARYRYLRPGSVFEYAPGNLTSSAEEGARLPPPVI